MNRRNFLKLALASTLFGGTRSVFAGRKPPVSDNDYSVLLPNFMDGFINAEDVAYLNETIPAQFEAYRHLFPVLTEPPRYIILNTLQETLIAYGNQPIFPDIFGDETLTLFDAQYLLVTTRFGSVATPHRGNDIAQFGKAVYLKQHPQKGYRPPGDLLLEEMLHVQQDITVMRHIIEQDELDPMACLHGQLKGISELGAHFYTDELRGELDYIFVMDDGTHSEHAADAIHQLAERLHTDDETMLQAILFDVAAYIKLDAIAIAETEKHIWQMVTTWRYARDTEGNATDIAPAFMPFD